MVFLPTGWINCCRISSQQIVGAGLGQMTVGGKQSRAHPNSRRTNRCNAQ